MPSSFDSGQPGGVVRLPTLEEMLKKHGLPPEPPKAQDASVLAASQPPASTLEACTALLEAQRAELEALRAQAQAIICEANEEAAALRLSAQKAFEDTEAQATALLDEAAQQKESLLAKALTEAEAMLRDAQNRRDEVFNAAKEAARAEVEAQAALEQKAAADRLDAIIASLEEGYHSAAARLEAQADTFFEQVEAQQAQLALKICQKILHMVFDAHDEAYRGIIHQLVQSMAERNALCIRVSPWEYTRFFKDADQPLAIELAAHHITAKEDPLLEKSQCVVETECGNVEAGIDLQLQRLGIWLGASEEKEEA